MAEKHNRPNLEFDQLVSKHIAEELRHKAENFILNLTAGDKTSTVKSFCILDKPRHVLQRDFPVAF